MQSIISMIIRADRFCFNVVNGSMKCSILDKCMPYMTLLGSTTFGILISLLMLILDALGIIETGIFVPICIMVSQVMIHTIKITFNRPRPKITMIHINLHAIYNELKNHSFPSGHTGAAFAIALSLHKIFQSNFFMEFIVFIAILVGISRMYLGVHFPTDVFFGAMISIVTVLVLYKYIHIFVKIIE